MTAAPILYTQTPSQTTQISLLPFHIDYSGPANISQYFVPRPRLRQSIGEGDGNDNDSLEAAFRGRMVVSTPVKIPDGFTGVVCKNMASTTSITTTLKSEEMRPTKRVKRDDSTRPRREVEIKKYSMDSDEEEEEEETVQQEPEEQSVQEEVEQPAEELEFKVESEDQAKEEKEVEVEPVEEETVEPQVRLQGLVPESVFSVVNVYNPDNAMSDNLYSKAIKEWIHLSALVHQC